MFALLLQALSWVALETRAGEVRLVWDTVANAEGYRIHYGTASGSYSTRVDVGNVSTCRLPGLQEGVTYFFAATAYNASGVESRFSNEVAAAIPYPSVPIADFTAGPRLGTVPLTVRFQETSKGDVRERTWRFGDGGTSSVQNPVHVYRAPGVYTVTLSVAGAKGGRHKTRRDFVTVTTKAPDSGLVAAYGFEEVGGSTVVDASTRGNHGRIAGARRTVRRAAAGSKSMFFRGSGNRVVVPNHPSLELSDGMTLEAWVFPTSGGESWQTVLVKEDGIGNSAYYLYAPGFENRALFGARIGAYQVQSSAMRLPVGRWTHLTGTYDGSRLRLYQNGVLAGSMLQRGLIPKSNGVLSIGSNAIWGESFRGYIDEVRVYNRALSPLEINVDRRRPATPAGPVGLQIVVSRSPTREYPRLSRGLPVSGAIYAFADAAPDIARVKFWLNDPSPARTARGTWVIPSFSDRPHFFVSSNADRSHPKALAGSHLSGQVHVFTSYFPGVKRVEFWLDDPGPGAPLGASMHTESFAPYDLLGSAADGSALPLDTATLARGRHTITARLQLIDGKTRRLGPVAFVID